MSSLGIGGLGPWEDRSALIREKHPNPHAVAGHLNNHNLWHIWVMPLGWRPPIGMGPGFPGVRV